MSTIDQDISAIPLLRHRDTVFNPADQDDFVSKYEITNDHLSNTTVVELNTFKDEVNVVKDEMVIHEENVSNNTDIVTASANYKGLWTGLSGALNIPASVGHNGTSWLLLNNVADITLTEPTSLNTDWMESVSKNYVDTKPTGYKNLIINGGMDIWQRGESFVSPVANSYIADRWLSTIGIDTADKVGNSLKVVGDSWLIASTRVELLGNDFKAGNQYMLSFVLNAIDTAVIVTITYRLGDAFVSTELGAFDISSQITSGVNSKIVVPFTPLTDQDLGTMDNMQIAIDSTNANTMYISKVQLEQGSVATDFEQRPYGLELSLCQRYYQIIDGRSFNGNNTNTTVARIQGKLSPEMRISPDATLLNEFIIRQGATSFTSSGAVLGNESTAKGFAMSVSGFTGLTEGAAIMGLSTTVDFVALDAEL